MQSHTPPIPADAPAALVFADKWLSKVENLFAFLAAICIFGLMLLGIAQVLGRQLFDMPVPGYIDFVELSMVTFAFLAVAYCQRLGGHVRMDLFVRMVHGRTRWLLEFVTTTAPIFLVMVLIYFGWTHFVRAYEFGDSTIDMEIPTWPSKIVVPISFVVLWLRLIVQSVGYARLLIHPDAAPVAVPLILTEKDIAEKEIEDSLGGERS
jgi:TRAP-type C4-dicarboxylate transport system permease small subunit